MQENVIKNVRIIDYLYTIMYYKGTINNLLRKQQL
nr:MAG TPA: hypothetical protein [Caudoviricetes sp.]